jgi:hypothetical protein
MLTIYCIAEVPRSGTVTPKAHKSVGVGLARASSYPRSGHRGSFDKEEGEDEYNHALFDGIRLSDEGSGDIFDSDKDNSGYDGRCSADDDEATDEEKADQDRQPGGNLKRVSSHPAFHSSVAVPAPLPLLSFGVEAIKYGALTATGQEISAVEHIEDDAGTSPLQDPLHCR